MELGSAIIIGPLDLAGLIGAAFVLGLLLAAPIASLPRRIRSVRESRSEAKGRNAKLANFLRSDAFAVQATSHSRSPARAAPRDPGEPFTPDTMLRVDVDNQPALGQIWGDAGRESTLATIAKVLRRGVRSQPRGSDQTSDEVKTIAGDGFVILVRGSNESAGSSIARRLRRSLASMKADPASSDIHLTASFGVAQRLAGESYADWNARAEAALRSAKESGVGEIVEASIADPVMLLPPPAKAA